MTYIIAYAIVHPSQRNKKAIMSSVNRVILVGRIGKDPETRYMPNGDPVTNCSLATSDTWKDKSGEKAEKTEWHNLTFYKKLAEIAGEYLKKGSLIYVEGKLSTRKWQDKDGNDRYTTEIIVGEMKMLSGKNEGQAPAKSNATPMRKQDPADDLDIPF